MLKGARMPLRRQPLELRKAMDLLQQEIVNIGVTLVIPRNMRLRLREDEPETFPPHSVDENKSEYGEDSRMTAKMANCREWIFLDRLL